jgi:enoyl-CoA hydratase/carnithine racemase
MYQEVTAALRRRRQRRGGRRGGAHRARVGLHLGSGPGRNGGHRHRDRRRGGRPGVHGPARLPHDLSVPLLAAVNGVAVGLGFTLLAHCNLVLVDAEARLRVPFAELGVPPEAASSVLFPARMGWQQAARILLTSDWVSARRTVELGLALQGVRRRHRARRDGRPGGPDRRPPRAATRAITSLMRAATRRRARGQPREQAAFAATARRGGVRRAPWPSSPPRPPPDLTCASASPPS